MNDRFTDEELRAAYTARPNQHARKHGRDCPSPEALLAALRGEGSEEERLRVLDHALKCDACRPELALLRSVSGAAEEKSSAAPAPRTWRRFAPMAAAAMIVLALGVVSVTQFLNRGTNVMRGEANAVALITPPRAAVVSPASASFVWHRVPGALRYTLEVDAADGTVMMNTMTTDTARVVRLSANTGDARWWVRAHMDDGTEKRSEAREIRIR